MRLFELAEALGWEKSRVPHQVAQMAACELVTKENCDSERRGAFVVVTTHGRRDIHAAVPGHVDAVCRLFIDRLTPAQLASIADIAQGVLADLDEGDRRRG